LMDEESDEALLEVDGESLENGSSSDNTESQNIFEQECVEEDKDIKSVDLVKEEEEIICVLEQEGDIEIDDHADKSDRGSVEI
ncbi:hypothetical protein JJ728_23305, partial [Salmonella enterica subsp. enterica serovar Typhi]|uniref:hypothetical protein n=1 Tax=Salmonella enterica TaxID=28901 RepID=UPI001914E242